jgi:predicted nucleic-acid-binding Zn-ribbon protein
MNRPSQCFKCGSTDVIADAKVIDTADYSVQKDLSVAAFRSPDAFIFKGQVTTTVSAWVCASCGFIELYADNPGGLKIDGG